MTHIAIQEALDGKNVEWMEKVSDAQGAAQLAMRRRHVRRDNARQLFRAVGPEDAAKLFSERERKRTHRQRSISM
jgi:hypothetical protein